MRARVLAVAAWLAGVPAFTATSLAAASATAPALPLRSLSPSAPAKAAVAQSGAAREPGSELIVYHVIMGQGDAVWEKFGHNALWIRDTISGSDLAYNWGVFDFTSEDFIPRFLRGSMRYWVEAYPALPMIDAYVRENRSVWVQELVLTPAEKHALREYVRWNAREENKYYTYDYYRDNCSTRVRDALDRVLGGRLQAATDTAMTATTYRWHTRRLTQELPFIYAGIDIMLGQPTDRPISVWEEMFLPMRLQHHLRGFELVEEDGTVRKLVASEQRLFAAQRSPEPSEPPRSLPVFLITGLAWAGLILLASRDSGRGVMLARIGMVVHAVIWPLFAGLAGTLMLLTWLFTNHWAAFPNENLLQLAPLSLALLAATVAFVARGRWARGAVILAAVVAALSVLGFVLQILPAFDQVNGETIALALPVHLALLWALMRRRTRSSEA